MSSEPLSASPIVQAPDTAEKGLLIAVLLLVLMGVGAMLMMI